jgi:hypothetical protein
MAVAGVKIAKPGGAKLDKFEESVSQVCRALYCEWTDQSYFDVLYGVLYLEGGGVCSYQLYASLPPLWARVEELVMVVVLVLCRHFMHVPTYGFGAIIQLKLHMPSGEISSQRGGDIAFF